MFQRLFIYFDNLRRFNHDVRMYLLTSALVGFSYFGVLTVLLNIYLLRLGYGTEFIGLANSSTALAFALFSVPSGALGSRFGYRRLVIAGATCLTVATAALPLAEFLPLRWREVGIVAARLLSGLGFSLYAVNSTPYLVAASTPEERNQVFALQTAMPPVIGFIGNLVGGVMPTIFAAGLGLTLDHPATYRYPILITGLLMSPAVWAIFQTREIKAQSTITPGQVRAVVPWLLLAFLAITSLLRMTGESASRSFFNVYLDASLGVSTVRIGLITALCQVLAGTAAMFSPVVIDRFGKVVTVITATVGMAGSLLLLAFVPHWLAASAGFMGIIGMLSISNVASSLFQMEIVKPAQRGVVSGITSTAMGLGYASMAFSGGYLIPLIGYDGYFSLGALMVLCSALLFWSYFRVPRGEYQQIAPPAA